MINLDINQSQNRRKNRQNDPLSNTGGSRVTRTLDDELEAIRNGTFQYDDEEGDKRSSGYYYTNNKETQNLTELDYYLAGLNDLNMPNSQPQPNGTDDTGNLSGILRGTANYIGAGLDYGGQVFFNNAALLGTEIAGAYNAIDNAVPEITVIGKSGDDKERPLRNTPHGWLPPEAQQEIARKHWHAGIAEAPAWAGAKWKEGMSAIDYWINGTDKSFIDRVTHGGGTATGFGGASAVIRGGIDKLIHMLPAKDPRAMILKAIASTLEAGTEAGGFIIDQYSKDPTILTDPDKLIGTAKIAGMNFAANAVPDMVLDAAGNFVGGMLPVKGLMPKIAKGMFGEVIKENIQEAYQTATERATEKTFNSGDLSIGNFWNNLKGEYQNIVSPYTDEQGNQHSGYLWEQLPEVSASTLLSTGVMTAIGWPSPKKRGHIFTKKGREQMQRVSDKEDWEIDMRDPQKRQEWIDSQNEARYNGLKSHRDNLTTQLNNLTAQRDNLRTEINRAYENLGEGTIGEDVASEMARAAEIAQMEQQLKDTEQKIKTAEQYLTVTDAKIANFWGRQTDVISGQNLVQDDRPDSAEMSLFPDADTINRAIPEQATNIDTANMDAVQETTTVPDTQQVQNIPPIYDADTVTPGATEQSEPLATVMGANLDTVTDSTAPTENIKGSSDTGNIQNNNNEPDLIADIRNDDDISPMDMLFGTGNDNQVDAQQNNLPEDFDDVEDEPDDNLEGSYGEQYNQLIPNDYNQDYGNNGQNVGTFVFSTKSNDYSFNIFATEHSGNGALNDRIRRWNGRYFEIRNNRGKVIATYVPAFGTFYFSDDIAKAHSLRWRQKFEYDFRANLQNYLNGGGLLDESGNLKPDGNEAFRKRWSTRIADDERAFDSDTLQPEDIDTPEVGKMTVQYQNNKGQEVSKDLSVVLGEFGDNMPEHKKYYGSYFDIQYGGRTVARYSPRTGKVNFAKGINPKVKQAVIEQLKRKAKSFMRKAGFLDSNGRIIPDGNEEYRTRRNAVNNTPNLMLATRSNVQSPNVNSYGKTERIRTIKGTEADIRYRVVDADSLIASTNDKGTPNPHYPQELQPRQRNRAASNEQIMRMSSNLDPELLAENRLASDGAPVIGSDGVVESGNGRIIAIRQAYRYGTADNYHNWIIRNAARFGLNPNDIAGIRNPVLVRERISPVDRVKFAREANESSTSGMSMTEHAITDADNITPDILNLFDPDKSLLANKDFLQAFVSIIPHSERNNFFQRDGKISKAGLDRVLNALIAKAYNDSGILNRLNEVYYDDIKNVSNALIQAAAKMAVFENGGYSPEISIRKDIAQAVRVLAQLKEEGLTVADYMSQLTLFNDDKISGTAMKLLQFFDRNKRSAKRIAKALMHYADSAMNEAKQGQALMFEDSARDKDTILNEAIRVAETEDNAKDKNTGNSGQSETYNQQTQEDEGQQSWIDSAINFVSGLLGRNSNNTTTATDTATNSMQENNTATRTIKVKGADGKEHTLTARRKSFDAKHSKAKQYHGDYIEFTDETGRVVARWSPYSRQFQMANVQDADVLQPQIIHSLSNYTNDFLRDFGYLDKYDRLIDDGNREFRRKYRARQDTTPEGKTVHRDNLDTEPKKKRKDTRSLWQRWDDARKEKKRHERTRKRVQARLRYTLRKLQEDRVYQSRLNEKEMAEIFGKTYEGPLELTKEEKKEIKHKADIISEAYSHVITARIGAAAHLAGMSVEDYHKLWKLRIVKADIANTQGQTKFQPARTEIDKNGKEIFREAETIIYLTQLEDASTVLHEFAHIFLRDYQDLIASVDDLPSKVKKDWLYLTRWLGISDIDPHLPAPNNIEDPETGEIKYVPTAGARTVEQQYRYQNAQEKFAVAFEQYYMTGKAPKSRLQRVFNYFKDWMRSVYGAIQNIKYAGSDGRLHEVELSPEVKRIFGRMLKGSNYYIPSTESAKARIERTNNPQHGEEFHNQTASGQDYDLSREGNTIVKEKAKSQSVTSDNDTIPEVQSPHAFSSTESLQHDSDNVNSSGSTRISRSNDSFVTTKDIEQYEQLALHATGHIIRGNKFDLRYIGTGQGHSSYGWGIYFAQNPDVSQSYRHYGLDASKCFLDDDGNPIQVDENVARVTLEQLREYYGEYSFEEIINYNNKQAAYYRAYLNNTLHSYQKQFIDNLRLDKESIKYLIQLHENMAQLLNKTATFKIPSGNIYMADIPENDTLLDWDSDNQPEKVQKGIQRVIATLAKYGVDTKWLDAIKQARTGQEIYHTLEHAVANLVRDNRLSSRKLGAINRTDMAASLILNKAGIPGLRYWDNGSRANKQGTRNFVIWNTSMIKLLGLTKGSDADAKQYFREQAAKSQSSHNKNSEIYNQSAGLVRTDEDFTNSAEAKRQYDAVVQKYKNTPQWMKAPNGKKSNLSEKQWVSVRTPNFKKWFGDWENNPQNASKVLDANGEPLVVYHGSPNGSFNTFKVIGEGGSSSTGAWFMNNKYVAQTYTRNSPASRVYAVFLNIRNPYTLDAKNRGWNELAVIGRKAITTDHVVRGVWANVIGNGNHDGVIIRNVVDPYRSVDDYILRIPSNIKSATHNNGSFSHNHDEIYKQIIGIDGAQRLDEAEGITTRMDSLNVARAMERKGMPVKKIWLATGWERGTEGKWRYEIFDGKIISKHKLNPKTFNEYNALLDKANPITDEIEKLLFEKSEEMLRKARDGYITIDEARKQYQEYQDSLLGDNGDKPDFSRLTARELKRLQKLAEIYDVKELQDIFDAPELYKAYPELRNVKISLQEFIDDDDTAALYSPPMNTIYLSLGHISNQRELRKTLIHEVQHAIQIIEGFAAGSTPGTFRTNAQGNVNMLPYLRRNYSQAARRLLANISPELQKKFRSLRLKEKKLGKKEFNALLKKFLSADERKLYNQWHTIRAIGQNLTYYWPTVVTSMPSEAAYMFTAGEVEARNAQTRSGWGEKRRRNTTLDASEDIEGNRELQILLNSYGRHYTETYNQPLNNDVDLDRKVSVISIKPNTKFDNVPFWQRMKVFDKEERSKILAKFKNGAVVNEHTGLTITLSKVGLDHILDTARNNDNTGGAVSYQAIPYLDILAKNAYRVETHRDLKPSTTKIEGQPGNLKQVHRFLVPIELNDDIHILKLTAKEYENGKANIDEVSLYDLKYTKKMSAHPSQNSPNLIGQAAGTIGSTDSISVRDMLEGVNDVYGNPYSETYNQIIGIKGAEELDKTEGSHTRMDNLRIARRMGRKGLPAATIWAATGWTRGKDSKWRMEIPDGKINREKLDELRKISREFKALQDFYDNNPNYIDTQEDINHYNELESSYYVNLPEVFDAPELYSAYPDLRNVTVWVDSETDGAAYYDEELNAIAISSSDDNFSKKRELRRSIIHEIQHAVQVLEGFATGWDFSPNKDAKYKRYLKVFRSMMKNLNGNSFDIISDILSAEQKGDYRKMLGLINTLSDYELEQYNNIRDAWVNVQDRRDYLFSEYMRHSGEVEARNAERRAYWGDKRKHSTPLDKSEDISRDEQIVGRLPKKSSTNNGFMTQADVERFNQLHYHGTRHVILDNRFDLQYLHSGEGTNFYGAGFYFAEHPAVAESYRRYGLPNGGIGTMKVTLKNGKTLELKDKTDYPSDIYKYIVSQFMSNPDKDFDYIRNDVEGWLNRIIQISQEPEQYINLLEQLDEIENITLSNPLKGNLYNVDIPENYELLDWNNTLRNQPEKITSIINYIIDTLHNNPAEIAAWGFARFTNNPEANQKELQRIISELIPVFRQFEEKHIDNHRYKSKNSGYAWMDFNHFKRLPQYKLLKTIIHDTKILDELHGVLLNLSDTNGNEARITKEWTGENLYWTLAELTGSPINASMYLNSLGIPGHRYWDRNSRTRQQGTHNFVIWNTDRLKIAGVEGDKEAVDYFGNTLLQQLTGNPDETYNQVIGEKGARLIDRAIGAEWLTYNLDLAKKMRQLGFKPRTIRRSTGWELGHEGQWKYETRDGNLKEGLKFKATVPDIDIADDYSIYDGLPFGFETQPFYRTTLGNILDNVDLFTAYPQLKNTQVTFVQGNDFEHNGIHYPNGSSAFDNSITLEGNFHFDGTYLYPDLNQNTILTLIHEIQHAIQRIEGFAGGSSMDLAIKNSPKAKEYDRRIEALEKQIDAIYVQPTNFDMRADNPQTQEYYELERKLEGLLEEKDNFIQNAMNDGTARNLYMRSAGETEARNIMTRHRMNEAQRRDTLLRDTEDFKHAELLDENGESYNQTNNQERKNTQQVEADNLEWTLQISQQQLETVRRLYQNTTQWMKAPNGQHTNLTEKQWLQVRTPNFKRWFGDWENDTQNASKVLDVNGEPLIVYHGTPHGGFSVFNIGGATNQTKDTGAYFTSSISGSEFYANYSGSDNPDKQIYPVFLNIRNPYIHDAQGRYWAELGNVWIDVSDGFPIYNKQDGSPFLSTYDALDYIRDVLHGEDEKDDLGYDKYEVQHDTEYNTTDDIIRGVWDGDLGDGNHDGVIFRDVCDPYEKIDEFITRTPSNIKSATNNNGMFDGSKGDIYKQTINPEQNNALQVVSYNLEWTLRISQKQLDTVRRLYQGTDKWMKAPNGEDTNLTENQWLQVRTPNFKRWFGDWEKHPESASKVLDTNGEPLVVTHIARGKGGFSIFNTNGYFSIDGDKTSGTGAWFADLKGNEDISLDTAGIYTATEGDNIYHVFLNIRNPYVYDAEGKRWQRVGKVWIEDKYGSPIYHNLDGKAFSNLSWANGFIRDRLGNDRDRYSVRYSDFQTSDDLVRFVRNGKIGNGNHDGVIIRNLRDMSVWGIDDYIAFDPNQIKSATNNNGEFSLSNDEIYKQTSSQIVEEATAWGNIVDQFMDGKISRKTHGNLLHVMNTPIVFSLVGMERLPIEIRVDNMHKILLRKHHISPDILKQIPQALADPIMIFKSEHDLSRNRDSRIIFTELKEKDNNGNERPIMAAITLGKNNLSKGYAINELTTVYKKDTSSKQGLTPEEDIYDWITRKFKDGSHMNLLLYVNKQKARQGAISSGFRPIVFDTLDKLPESIPDEKDLARLNSQNDSYTTETYFQIGAKRKNEMDNALARRRQDMTPEQRANAINEIEKLGESVRQGGNPKVEKIATHWLLGGHIILPEDNYKILDAIRISEQQHLDPMSFDDPNEILAKYTIKETKADKRINPDNVPEFSHKVTYDNGITVYTVDDTKEGQEAVRSIIDTHWGEDANPWCLAARTVNQDFDEPEYEDEDEYEYEVEREPDLTQAWEYWSNTYNAVDKRIAFQNGKLLAFCASEDDTNTWWDREDKPHNGIPYTIKEHGNTFVYSYNETTGQSIKIKENLSYGTIRTWYENEISRSEQLSDGTQRSWYKNGQLQSEKLPDGTEHRWKDNGQLIVEQLPNGTERRWSEVNGVLKYERLPDGTERTYFDNGRLQTEYLPDERVKREWYENGEIQKRSDGITHGQLKSEIFYNGTERSWYESGRLHIEQLRDRHSLANYTIREWYDNDSKNPKSEYLPNGSKRTWFENGNQKSEDIPFKHNKHWYENGNRKSERLNDGTERSWYENGQLEMESSQDSLHNYTTREWYDNRPIKQREDGEIHGQLRCEYLPGEEAHYWDEAGNPIDENGNLIPNSTSSEEVYNQTADNLQAANNYFNNYKKEHPDQFITPDALAQMERYDQLVTHATGHIIWNNRFDLRFVGSGEGNAAFGFGAYFEQNPEIARSYRHMGLSWKDEAGDIVLTLKNGKTLSLWERNDWRHDYPYTANAIYQFKLFFDNHPNATTQEALSAVKDDYKALIEKSKRSRHDKDMLEEYTKTLHAVNSIASLSYTKGRNGNIYQFDIPEDYELLDWDADLDQQPEKIKKSIRKIINALSRKGYSRNELSLLSPHIGELDTGESFYEAIVNVFEDADRNNIDLYNLKRKGITRADARTSWLLNRYGIPGHRYWDGLSRNSEEGTHNFVIWNMDRVKMVGIDPSSDDFARKTFYNGGIQQLPLFDNDGNPAETYSQIIGVEGAVRNDIKNGNSHIMDNLGIAIAMTKENETPQKIKLATGWELGYDGEWRYEIQDGNVDLRFLKLVEPSFDNDGIFLPIKLEHIYNNPELFKAYPKLKNLSVRFKNLEPFVSGYYYHDDNPEDRYIAISLGFLNNPEEVRLTLIHEIQHAIQHIEGFAEGGSYDNVIIGGKQAISLANKIINSRLEGASKELIKAKELYKRGFSKSAMSIVNSLDKHEQQQFERIKPDLDLLRKGLLKLDTTYNYMGGEIEARNASRRADFTPEQRRKSLLVDTQDQNTWLISQKYTPQNFNIVETLDDNDNGENGNDKEASRKGTDSFITPEQLEQYDQLVYHGTDNTIRGNSFDLRYVGTSEGSAAYGYGAYFTEHLDVAQEYRHYGDEHKGDFRISISTNNGKTYKSIGANIWNIGVNAYWDAMLHDLRVKATQSHIHDVNIDTLKKDILKSYKRELKEHKGVMSELERELKNNPQNDTQDKIKLRSQYINFVKEKINALNSVNGIDVLPPKNGNIYSFDIPENDMLLDWNKSMGRQPESVKKARREILQEIKYWGLDNSEAKNAKTGEDFYHALTNLFKHSWDYNFAYPQSGISDPQQRASLILNMHGIPGLRYLNSGSKKKKRGTHNFVIWNSNTIKMLGIMPDSNPEAIEHFNDTARQKNNTHPNETYNQTAINNELEHNSQSRTTDSFLTQEAKAQIDTVRKKYQNTTAWLKAPNGEKSYLSELQWLLVRTPNFKHWFGDWENNPQQSSKVIDEHGEPLVVYHGTPYGGFDTFDTYGEDNNKSTGAWFTSEEKNAWSYVGRGVYNPNATVYEVFLNIRNPFIFEANGRYWNELGDVFIRDNVDYDIIETKDDGSFFTSLDDASEYIREVLGDNERFSPDMDYDFSRTSDIVKHVWAGDMDGEKNHDGVIFKNIIDTGAASQGEIESDVFVVPAPNNIKSATRNNGEYSLSNDEIYKQAIGYLGAKAIDKANGNSNLIDSLHMAQRMEERGIKPRTIKRSTGWEIGIEGKWKFELQDG